MYFWNITKLKADFNEGRIREQHTFVYFFIVSILACFGIETLSIIDLAIVAIGSYYIYSCNGSDQGHDFIAKYYVISWVVTIRCMPIYLILLSSSIVTTQVKLINEYGQAYESSHYKFSEDPFVMIATSILLIIVYWRTGVHMKQIKSAKVQNLKH